MEPFFQCRHCKTLKPVNIRLKGNQCYCSRPECQRARKAVWQKEKMTSDPLYRARQQACVRAWRKKRPLDQYQAQYRTEHPEYVENNRKLQKNRNLKRSKQLQVRKIVKMDTLKKPPEKSSLYLMNPYKIENSGKIVKMDALIVQISHLQADLGDLLPILT